MYSKALILLLILFSFGSWSQVLHDPTEPLKSNSNAEGELISIQSGVTNLTLSAIFVSDEHTHAVINSQNVVLGDVIDGATITQINPYSVTLVYEQQEHTINIKQQVKDVKIDVSNRF